MLKILLGVVAVAIATTLPILSCTIKV